MRVHRSRVTGWLLVGLTALTFSTSYLALAEKPEARSLRPSPDPDGEPLEILPVTAFAGTDSGCPTFGNFSRTFGSTTPPRYRGDVFGIDFDHVTLREIRMQLRILSGVSTTLWFSVHRRVIVNDQPTYQRILDEDIQVSVLGNGTPTYYSTSPTVADLNLALPPYCSGGSNDGLLCTNNGDCSGGECRGVYAIGAAWNSTAVTFGRDDLDVSDGLEFLHGAALARLSINEAPLRPGDIAEVDLAPSTLGLYSMQLCFDPVNGACCLPNTPPDDCVESLGEDCAEAGGFFSGERTDCASGGANCVFGACCDQCGVCTLDVAPLACTKGGGTWAGPGVACVSNLCEAVTGACCAGSRCIPDKCRTQCEQEEGGLYLGDGSSCAPNMCIGACCLADFGCADLTRLTCTQEQGSFRGEGTLCSLLPSALECGGACCHTLLGQPRCTDVNSRVECTPAFRVDPVYMGDATVCRTNPGNPTDPLTNTCAPANVVRGACCLANGICQITDDGACPFGSFVGNQTCDQITCETCCTSNMNQELVCSRTITGACGFLGGSANIASSCLEYPCDDLFGACCFLNRCEDDFSAEDCETDGGRFTADQTCGVACSTPLGACCRPNGTCTDLVNATECDSFGGSFRQDQSCTIVNPACPAFGACCTATGECSLVLQTDCESAAGYFAGPNTLCGMSTCLTGACCIGEACSELLSAACIAQLGEYLGDGTICESGTIVCGTTPGACCFTDGQCAEVLPQACLDAVGFFSGAATLCTPGESCLSGACCLFDGTCEERFDFLCEPPDGSFIGPGTQCGTSTCVTGACCVGEVCSELPGAVCTAQTGDYRGDGTTCDGGAIACGTTPGACCFTNGQCAVILPQECLDAGGFFSGANTLCTPGASCLSGACCLLNGTCEERFDFLCEPPDDHFLGPDTLCEANFCVAGDCNNDGVVNLDDYARLATCLSPSGGPDALLGDECRCIDLDHDGDVDLRDAATFWSAMTPIP